MSLIPPFTAETAHAKVKKAQDLWNGQNPKVIAQAYTPDSVWRNRSSFLVGTAAIEEFLTQKWEKEQNYRLRKELFAFTNNKIAVQFWYEYQDAHDGMKWKRCYGLEDWTFAEDGRMRKRQMSGNDVEITEAGRNPPGYSQCHFVVAGEYNRYVINMADVYTDCWFKADVDINAVEIDEAHW